MSMGLVLLTVVWFLIILSFLVLIHELGHFLAAKLVGVRVEEFGLGYPPRLKELFHWRGTIFSLNALPFGGFVRLYGDEGETLEKTSPTAPSADTAHQFSEQTIWKRLIIILAGVTVNFVFGTLAFAYIYSRIGIPAPSGEVLITTVIPDSPAATAGIQEGDVIVAAQDDHQEIRPTTANEFIYFVGENQGESITLTLDRDGQTQTSSVYVRTAEEIPAGEGAIGLGLNDSEMRFYPWWQMPLRGMWVGLQEAVAMGGLILQTLRQIVVDLFAHGTVPQEVAGPVGIVDQAVKVEVIKQGLLGNLKTAALLSINLAIMNLLPIPALDGGRAVFIVLEPLIGKNRRRRWEAKANTVGFVFLIGLIVLITVKDVVGIVF